MTAPVITADHTIGDGLVVRWRRHAEGEAVLSASRSAVMIHGSVVVDDDLRQWMTDATRAHDALKAGRDGEARAMVTHRRTRMFGGDLVPIEAEVTP